MRARVPLVLATACLAAGPAIAAAAPTTISFVSVQVKQKQTKSGFTITDNDFKGKTKIGHDTLACVYAKSGNTATCVIKVTLAKGTIRGRTKVSPTTTSGPVTILGGTGAYKGATGDGNFKNLNATGTRTSVVLRLK